MSPMYQEGCRAAGRQRWRPQQAGESESFPGRGGVPSRPRLEAFGLLLLLIGCARGPDVRFTPEEVAAYDPFSAPVPIRVLTINVWSGLTYDGVFKVGQYPDEPEARYAELVRRVRDLEPDVIAIQEANPLPGYAQRLAADLDYQVISSVALGGMRLWSVGIPTNLREGAAILVRKPWTLVGLERGRLQGAGLVSNGVCLQLGEVTQVVLARAMINGKPLYVYAVHLHSAPYRGPLLDTIVRDLKSRHSEEEVEEALEELDVGLQRRAREIAALETFLEQTLPPGMPAVVLGDFNTAPESAELASLLEGGEWRDSFALRNPGADGTTWAPEENPNHREPESEGCPYRVLQAAFDRHAHRLDAILVRGNIPSDQILESRVVLQPIDGRCPSDHFGVLTTLEL